MDKAYRDALRSIPFLSLSQLEELSYLVKKSINEIKIRDLRAELPFPIFNGGVCEAVSVTELDGSGRYIVKTKCGLWVKTPRPLGFKNYEIICLRCK